MRHLYLPLALSTLLLAGCAAELDSSDAESTEEVDTAQSAIGTLLLSGTYTTPTQSGTLTYSWTRLFYRVGSGGWVNVDGTLHWGVLIKGYALTFYYGNDSTGPVAGTMILSAKLPDGTYPGTITFYDVDGNVTDTGTVSMTQVY